MGCPDPFSDHVRRFWPCWLPLWWLSLFLRSNISRQLMTYLSGRKPTSSSSEAPVSMAEGSMPWQTSSAKGESADEHFKYQYHPGGDKSKAPKDAPSALHSVIVPNVRLPKVHFSSYIARAHPLHCNSNK